MYHIVCPAHKRRKVFTNEVENSLKQICNEIQECYEIYFLEIGADIDHVHFLVQSVPMLSPTSIVKTIKSIIAREIFKSNPEVKEKLLGGKLWTSGYYINTVSRYGAEKQIQNYIKNQGINYEKDYKVVTKNQKQDLFES
jgi:putative transposase